MNDSSNSNSFKVMSIRKMEKYALITYRVCVGLRQSFPENIRRKAERDVRQEVGMVAVL